MVTPVSYVAVALLLAAVFIASCTTVKLPQGEDFSIQRALYVSEGMTDSEVLQVMEQPPYDRLIGGAGGDSSETWVWVYSIGGDTKTFSVLFNHSEVTATSVLVE